MNSTQNERITQITSTTLIVGVDIASLSMWLGPRISGEWK
ncbi:hypothetical protein SAMN02799624_04303 [Paenibacillus sp. UNC496MF]|nr:hypothetical protein SAMN02799624_04303 [Paenibacillus sp. UNC496MF]